VAGRVQVALLRAEDLQPSGDEVLARGLVGVHVVGVRDRVNSGPQELLGVVAGDLRQRVVHAQVAAVRGHEAHADRRLLERAPEPLVGLGQLALGLLHRGDVLGEQHAALDRAVAVAQRGDLDPVVAGAAAELERLRVPAERGAVTRREQCRVRG